MWIWVKNLHRQSSKGKGRWLGNWCIWHARGGWERWDCWAWRRGGSWWESHQCVLKEGVEETNSSWCYPSKGKEAKGTKWNTGIFHWENLSKRQWYYKHDPTLDKVAWWDCGDIPGDIQNSTGHSLKQPVPIDSPFSRRLD